MKTVRKPSQTPRPEILGRPAIPGLVLPGCWFAPAWARHATGKSVGCRTTWVLFLVLASCSFAETPAGWSTNWPAVLAQARSQNRPVVLYFSATWCAPCRQMTRTTLQHTNVLKTLERFERAALDLDANQETAGLFTINAVPAFVLLDEEGDELDRAAGYMDAELFKTWLTAGLLKHSIATEKRKQFLAQKQKLLAALQGSEPSQRQSAVAELFDLCSHREKSHQQFALEQLQLLAGLEPAQLLPGLNHPSLATRIQVANLFRRQFGEAFPVDPWEKPPARLQAIEKVSQWPAFQTSSASPVKK